MNKSFPETPQTIRKGLAAFIAVLGLVINLVGCAPAAGPAETNRNATETSAAKTVAVLATQFSMDQNSTSTPTLARRFTATPTIETQSLTPLAQPTAATSSQTPEPQNKCDVAAYLADVTISDGTVIAPGAAFTKTWRLINDGSCTWTSDYRLVFVSGEAMTGITSKAITKKDVPPQGVIEISVAMTAPKTEGDHAGFWKLENASGEQFGITPQGNAFWVRIVVGTLPKGTPAVTSVVVYPEYTGWAGYCGKGHTANFSAVITSNNAGNVTYHWAEKSNFLNSDPHTLKFVGPGAITVTASFVIKKAYYEGYVQIGIDEPNHQTFDKVRYTVTCTDK